MPTYNTNVDVEIDIMDVLHEVEIQCECGADSQWCLCTNGTLEIEACESCIDNCADGRSGEAWDDGHAEGYEEGFKKGEESQQIIVTEFKDA